MKSRITQIYHQKKEKRKKKSLIRILVNETLGTLKQKSGKNLKSYKILCINKI